MNIIILTTFPSIVEAKKISKLLLEKKLVACVQLKEIESLYMWNDKVEEEKEIQGIIKTKKSLFKEIKEVIKKEHSYEVPQIIELEIDGGNREYLKWVEEVTR